MSAFLVTGAGGFIGRAMAARLRQDGADVVALDSRDGDIAEAATLAPHAGRRFDRVFHLAARTFVPDSWNDVAGFHRTNTGGTLNVLEFCRTSSAPLTYVSAYLYGQVREQPIREDCPLVPNNPYALSKVFAEQACEFFARTHGIPITVVRPFNIYGPGQGEQFLIPAILRQALEGDVIQVKDLAPKRDYLYLDDLVDLLAATLQAPAGHNIYNAGTGNSLSVAEVITAIQAETATSKPVLSAQVPRVQEIDDTRADAAKARRELGWSPKHSFRGGIRAILNAMQEAS
ncbi:MAG: NAD-dependent nucleoside-diphosphate-sugar epimerase protein [Betaproteobacteria bacterium]|nr:NAD-dependent nucleoside-diphosphate-sugar epimerase protein [Betaproteobacteria bacterium]